MERTPDLKTLNAKIEERNVRVARLSDLPSFKKHPLFSLDGPVNPFLLTLPSQPNLAQACEAFWASWCKSIPAGNHIFWRRRLRQRPLETIYPRGVSLTAAFSVEGKP